jgi:tetratricopeptide (TPR) repeat protein
MKPASIVALLAIFSAAAIAQNGTDDAHASTSCLELNQAAMTQLVSGRSAQAEASLLAARISGDERTQGACLGQIFNNMAGVMSLSGRNAEAERLAEQSVRILEKFYSPDDWRLLRALQILAAVRLELGKTAQAREAVNRIQSIRIKRPEDGAIVHATIGALLQIEGRRSEAEAEYHEAFRAVEEAPREDSADAASILYGLGSLYLKEQRLSEARRELDRALAIYDRAKDAVPLDRIKFLDLRGVLHARLGEWQQSELDFCDGLSMLDRQPYADPALLRSLLTNYSYALRRNHHRREARSIEARNAALPTNRKSAAVVDLTELLVEKNAAKR